MKPNTEPSIVCPTYGAMSVSLSLQPRRGAQLVVSYAQIREHRKPTEFTRSRPTPFAEVTLALRGKQSRLTYGRLYFF
jgi:hypothetical protein